MKPHSKFIVRERICWGWSFLVISALLSGCGYTQLATERRHPPAPLFPANLAIVYSTDDATFDSFDGSILKNIGTREVKAMFILSESEKARIYEALREMDWSLYGESFGGMGFDRRKLYVRCGNIQKDLSWMTGLRGDDEAAAQLRHLQEVLDEVLFNNVYYLMLPPYEGPSRL